MSDEQEWPLQSGTIAAQVYAFLHANPDEELTAADVGIKFSAPAHRISVLLAGAVEAQLLQMRVDLDKPVGPGAQIYALGRNPLVTMTPPLSSVRPGVERLGKTLEAVQKGLRSDGPPRAAGVDLRGVQIRKGVPVPGARTVGANGLPAASEQLRALFGKLQTGDSFDVEAALWQTVKNVAYRLQKEDKSLKYLVRKMGERVGIWRTA